MVNVSLSSSIFRRQYESSVVEESDIIEHVLKMLPTETDPSATSIFGGLTDQALRNVVAAHRAGYVLLSATRINWNGLLHSFIRCKSETRSTHVETWRATGIDLFSVPDDCFPEVLQQLHKMTMGCRSQSDWRGVRACLDSVVAGTRAASDEERGAALCLAQEACDRIIADCSRIHLPLHRLEKAFSEFARRIKQDIGEDWMQENYWPLSVEVCSLLKSDDDAVFEKVVLDDPEKGALLNRSALTTHSHNCKKVGGKGRLATRLAALVNEEVERAEKAMDGVVVRGFPPPMVWWAPKLGQRVS